MSGGNDGNFLNPKNLIPTILTGPLYYGAKELKKNMEPPKLPTPTAPPPGTPPPMRAMDDSGELARKQNRLRSMRYGYASTVSKTPSLAPAPGTLKATLGA